MTVIEFKRSGDQGRMKLIDPDLPDAESDYRWYLIRCRPGQHGKAKFELRRAGFRAVVIMARSDHWHPRLKIFKPKKAPAFDSYLFLRLPKVSPNWYRVRQCSSVEGVMTTIDVRGNIAPFAIAWKVVGRLLDRQRRGGFDQSEAGAIRRGEIEKGKHAKLRSIFRPGSRVKVKSGAFASFPGTVEKVGTRGEIEIIVLIFGRETPVTFTKPGELEVTDGSEAA